jgi:MFS transporter, DHA1 family, inner membrane transport protein
MRFGRPSIDVLALMTMSMACDLTTFVMPLIIGALVSQHGMTDTQVGFVATAQLMACALLSFAMAPRVRRLNPRATIALGLGLVALGNAITLLSHHAPVLIAARLSAGLGEALVNVVVGVLMARHRDPDRGFAMINIGITSGAVAVFLIAPLLAPAFGKDGIFWVLTALPVLALPCVLGIQTAAMDAAAPTGERRGFSAFGLTPASIAILLGIVGFGIAGNAVFIFVERIGEGVGVGYTQLVQMMLWVTVWTAAGPVAARIVGTRFGRMPILAFAFLGLAIACPMMGAPQNATVLFIGLNIGGFCLLLAAPFYSGLMVAMDPRGRLITLSRGVLAIGSAITPSIASLMLIGGGGFPAMGYWSAVVALVSLGLVYYAARSVGRPPAPAVALQLE